MSLQEIGLIPLIAGASAFALVLALWGIGLILYGRRKVAQEEELRARLRGPDSGTSAARTLRLFHAGNEQTVLVSGEAPRIGLWARMEERRVAAGWVLPLERLLFLVTVGCVLAGAVMYGLTARLLPVAFAMAAVPLAFWWVASLRMQSRWTAFNRQLIDALDLATRALRAGHPLSSSFQLVAEEVPAPVGTIFAEICQQQDMGLPIEDALRRAAIQSRSDDMRLLSATLSINIRTGGNLADVMAGLAKVIRERDRLGRRFRTLFAQTQFSKQVLLALPFAALLALHVISPGYVDVLYASLAGNLILVSAGVSLFLGWLLMNHMARIKI